MDQLRRGNTRAELSPAHAHLVGLAERGMAGLAEWLVDRGTDVTRSEPASGPALERLRQLGVRIHPAHCPRGTQLLVHGPEIPREHASRLTALRRGVAQGTVGQWLGRLVEGSIGLAVVGQRQASRAAAMIGWTLTRAGLDPSVVLGTSAPQLNGWARFGAGRHVVVEAITEAGVVAPAGPRVAVLLDVDSGVEPQAAERLEAVRGFVGSVPADGHVLTLPPTPRLIPALRDSLAAVESISLERGSTWWGADLREDRGRYRFRAFRGDRFAIEVRLQVPGRRNVLSALAAVAACDHLAVPAGEIKQGLEEFSGLSRDFESRGSYRGVTLVDDAGWDAASVCETLGIARQVFGPRQLWAVYSPASDDSLGVGGSSGFPAALAAADHVLVAEANLAGSSSVERGAIVGRLTAAGIRARGVASLDDAVRELDRYLEPGDVLVTLGAGEVGTIADAFIRRLSRDRQGR